MSQPQPQPQPQPIQTPILIVGAGPAGASLSNFLASHQHLSGITLSAAPGTAKEPRAHITNAAALECLRDLGLEDEVRALATPGNCMQHTRWCRSMAGEEWGRVFSWGNQPDRQGDYEAASPCRHVDLPQTLLEPILVREAVRRNWKVQFESEFLGFERLDDGAILSTVRDIPTGKTYTISSKYLFGCDGARSQIVKQLDLPLDKKPGQGLALNILVEADLSKYMATRNGNLHWIFTPEIEHPPWGWSCILRMVKAWHEWMFIILPSPGFTDFTVRPSNEEYEKRIREWIGDEQISIKILDVSKWYINETVAERYDDHEGRIFCLGDAVHRHPPFNGLGSNTCIQDAWNLAWKVAYVESGVADKKLLDSYSLERQPIGAGVIQRANQGLRDQTHVWEALGALDPDVEERKRQHAELSAPTDAGRQRRKKLREALAYTSQEFGGLGVEMNQLYESSAVFLADEKPGSRPPVPKDPVLQHQISTYPGSRLPHAWLNRRVPVEKPISTIDLAGHGAFCLLTGIGGDAWREAAEGACRDLGVKINVYSIGWQQDWEDVYGDWDRRKEVDDDGCLLIRPDRTICWRSMTMQESCNAALLNVLRGVLGRAR